VGVPASAIWYVDASDPAAVLRSSGPSDLEAAAAIARRLYPGLEPKSVGTAPISAFGAVATPRRVLVGCFPGVTVVCSAESAVATPSTLPDEWIRRVPSERTYLVAAEAEFAWGAFAEWRGGTLRRSFSAAPSYIHEDEGLPQPWERPFWAGEHPMQYPAGTMPDPQALPFHPQEFADSASAHWLGVRMIGAAHDGEIDPLSVLLCDFMMRDPSESAPEPSAPAPEPKKVKRGLFRRKVS
jgi:hypothetical protein